MVCTVDGWSDSIGSNTISSLLDGYDKSSLACLYIRGAGSDSPVCDRYFHIFEPEVLKSIFTRNTNTGEAFRSGQATGERQDAQQKALYSHFVAFRPHSLILARELVWKMGQWRSPALDAFLDDFQPDVLFFPIEGYIHFNRLTEYVIQRCRPQKVLCYMWDDNFTYKRCNWSPFWWLHRWWLKKSVKTLVNRCDALFAISPQMQRELKQAFGKESILLTKPVTSQPLQAKSYEQILENHNLSGESNTALRPIRLLYTGNMTVGRDKTLEQVAKAIQKVNAEGGRPFVLDIYTQTPQTRRMCKKLNLPGASCLQNKAPKNS